MDALKRFIPLFGIMFAIAYLGYHAWTGEQGVRSHMRIQTEIVQAQAELGRVRSEREAKEDRVSRLDETGPGVDVDYLEERARAVLRFAHPDEIVVTIDRAGAR